MAPGVIVAVSLSRDHTFSKENQESIRLLAGLGVEDDVHSGRTVKHRSRVARDPSQPNLRQVHLIHAELFDELRAKGFDLSPGDIGENITTRGIDLPALPAGALLHLGAGAIVQVTGLRNPCHQLDSFKPGLMKAVLDHDMSGKLIRKAGVMGVVLASGDLHPGDPIRIEMPEGDPRGLEVV